MNKEKVNIELLIESIDTLTFSIQWFKKSVDRCSSIVLKSEFSNPSDFEALETLTARFARSVDILTSKVYRSIDKVEMNNGKTLIEVIEFLEKIGVVTSFQQTKRLKELRNDIVHEYQQDDLNDLFRSIYKSSAILLEDADRAIRYANALISKYSEQ